MPKKEEQGTTEELKPVEELKNILNVSEGIHEAVKVTNNWRNGKEVTKEEYEKAIDRFLNAPMRGGK